MKGTILPDDANRSSCNSFLNETERNEDISSDIRREIDNRYQRSITNKSYQFPRAIENSCPTPEIAKQSINDRTLPHPHSFNSSLIIHDTSKIRLNKSISSIKKSSKIRTLSSVYLKKLKLPSIQAKNLTRSKNQSNIFKKTVAASYSILPKKKILTLNSKIPQSVHLVFK